MVRHTPAARKSLLFLPVLGLTASPAAQAASPLSLQLGDGWGDSNLGLGGELFASEATAVSSTQSLAPAMPIPERPIDAGESLRMEWADGGIALDPGAATAEPPQLVAQVLPTPGATQTQVEFTPGSATFDISGGTQAGENLFHRFDQLDLSAGQVANFLSQPQTEAVFSQIGGEASSIDGLLKVSGSSADLFLINPNGIVFGPNARLDLSGSFTATTADRLGFGGPGGEQWIDLLGEGFTAQTAIASQASGGIAGSLDALEFSLDAAGGAIVNQGQLAVGDGQSLGLLGNAVVNTGSLTAPGGEVTVLAASGGQRVSLAGGLLNLEVGAAAAGLPRTMLSVEASQAVAEATGLKLNADGSVALEGGMAIASGEVDVSSMSGAGGTARLLGDRVQVMGAVVDASGAGGGSVQVGGDYKGQGDLLRASTTQVDAASVLRADGIASTSDIRPDGGEVIVWSDGSTLFAGEATARGSAQGGNGGLVETSGQQQLVIAPTAKVSTAAPQGEMGEWLLDPADLTVIAVGGAAGIVGGTNDPVAASTIDRPTLEAALNGNNVNLQATNSISIDTPINTTANAAAGNLQLTTPTLNLNERIRLNGNLSGTATTVNVGANGGIQNGIDAVATGGTVNLATATYREGQTININRQVTLQGQGIGNTILSGDALGNGNTGAAAADNHQIMNVTGNGTNINGISFHDGLANGIATSFGGALANNANNVSISDSAFIDNRAVLEGGALINRGTLRIDRTTFANNQAQQDGGAIKQPGVAGTLTVVDSIFNDNVAGRDSGAIDVDANVILDNVTFDRNIAGNNGGVTDSSVGNITANNVRFRNNTAQRSGGAFSLRGSVISNFTAAEFSGNTAGTNGGAIFSTSNLTIGNTSLFLNNTAAGGYGAGILNRGNLTVDQTTFQDGQSIAGSGIFNENVAIISNSIFDGNTANRGITTGDGAAIYNTPNSILTVDNSNFLNNQADDFGGAIASFQGNVSVTNSTFANNQADNGGGLHHNDGSLAIADSQFLNNQAQVDGGAIDLDNLSNSNITQTLIQGNQAILDSGGGISIANMTNLDLQQVTLFQNQATRRGGAIAAQSSQNFSGIINISDSTIDQNQAVDNGGGIQFNAVASGGTLNISNSTLSNNRANNGGAMRVGDNGTVTLQNVTISGNQSNQDGAGLYSDGIADISQVTIANNVSDADNNGSGQGGGIFRRAGTIRLGNTIVANNQAVTGADLAGTFVDQGNNLIGISDGSSGFTNSTLVGTSAAPINPLLAPLGDYGGLTQTIALLPGSAAIDAGNSAIPTDQRGIGRVGAPDIGAFESRGFLINARGITSQTSGSNPTTHQLRLGIGSAFGEPVNGGQILFSAPTTGPSVILSPNPTPITIAGNSASISLTSNGITGNYDVVATANGMPNALFSLVNSVSPVPPPVPPIPPVQPPVPPVPPVVMPPLPEPLPEPLPGPVPAEPPLAEPEPPALPSFAERPMDVPKPELPGSPFPSSAEDAPLSMVDGSAIQAIDGIFSGEYVSYWQEGATEGSPIAQAIADSGSNPGASVAETAELLRKATATHGVNSAVVYALFVPQDKAADEGFGAVQVANMALTRRLETEEERDDDQLLLVLLPASGEAVSQLVDATRQEVMQQGRLFRMAVSDPEDNQSYRPLAQQLANWLVAPIEPDLERLELDNVMYALAPGLRSIPLTAMMDGDDYVIERYGLSLIPSVDLLETNFGVSPPTTQTLAAGANEFEQLADLPAVEIELNAIASRRESVDVLFNEDFTQANLVETQTQSQAKMLHLATHAEFNAGDLGSSYLQFWDGRLTLDDISQLGWNELELLILSACQTAISSPEAELGFAGLAAAAGVESTIASLWSVSDIGTLALMSEFYGQLADEPLRFEALRQAQLAMMAGETAIANQTLRTGRGDIELPPDWPLPEQANFSHPFYWAGFTLVGNPWW